MPKKSCSIPGCDTAVKARGYCKNHYQRWLRHGDPYAFTPKTVEVPLYRAMHARLNAYKTGRCSTPGCVRTKTQMALIHGRGDYESADRKKFRYSIRVEDYVELCARCHVLYDETEGWRLRERLPRTKA